MPIQKNFTVLGVNHKVQGDTEYPGAFDDPDYIDLLTVIISSNNIDFVGEECTPNPTHAKKIAQELLGEGHHQNVDPLVGPERDQLGIGNTGGGFSLPSASGGQYYVHCMIVSDQENREKEWVDRLIDRTAVNGLLICGHAHALIVAFRIRNLGYEVSARIYLPLSKLCGHQSQT